MIPIFAIIFGSSGMGILSVSMTTIGNVELVKLT
jgi:hypothetical protein